MQLISLSSLGVRSRPLSMPPLARERRAVSWRSVGLGLAGTVLICALTPYNDYALNNTFLVGNNLPIGVVMIMFLVALLVNGPLSRLVPERAMSSGELTVAFSMMLVSCAVPSSGLMRYLPPSLVSPFWHAAGDGDFRAVLEKLHLPGWIYPRFAGSGVDDWVNDPLVNGYVYRLGDGQAVPFGAWVRPAFMWGIFVLALYGALLCMVSLVRRQWVENERLAFPLAQVQATLVTAPEPGRFLNHHFRQRLFWMGFAGVFLLHIWNGCAGYWPRFFPRIPVYYVAYDLFAQAPWSYVHTRLKEAAVFFSVVGITYFLSRSVSFSLWFFFILDQVHRMLLGSAGGDPTAVGKQDDTFGGIIAFALALLWVGRDHWKLILKQAFRGERADEPRGRYLAYPTAFWLLMGCSGAMVWWLVLAGCTALGAAVLVVMLLGLFLVITRIIAETGLVHGQLLVPLYKPWQLLSSAGYASPVPLQTFYLTALVDSQHCDFREAAPVYASHAMRVSDRTVYDDDGADCDTREDRKLGRRLMGLMFLALAVAYVTSFASTLWTEYRVASTADDAGIMPINPWGVGDSPVYRIINPTLQYKHGTHTDLHSPGTHIAGGFAITGALAALRLYWPRWPLHPIGFLMRGTYPQEHLWLSIFLGWLANTLALRLGGPKLYQRLRPLFLGLIIGESAAAGFWLITGIVLSALGLPYRPIHIMPG